MNCLDDYKKKGLYVKNRIGSDSANAEVYLACDNNQKCNHVIKTIPLKIDSVNTLYKYYCLDKKMQDCNKDKININEILYNYHNDPRVMIHSDWVELFVMYLCKILIKKKICFNLTEAYEYSFCTQCKYKNYDVICSYLITELADEGDLKSWLKKERAPYELFVMFFQIFAGLYALRKYFNIIHNDLHTGNILVKKIPIDKEKPYLKYIIDGKKYYIPNIGYIFMIWDFGYAQIPGVLEISEYKQFRDDDLNRYKSIDVIDYTRITLTALYLIPDKYKVFKDIINYFIIQNSVKGIRLENILQIFDFYKKIDAKNLFNIFDFYTDVDKQNLLKKKVEEIVIEECSFDKPLKKVAFLKKNSYKPRKQIVILIPESFLFSKNLKELENNVSSRVDIITNEFDIKLSEGKNKETLVDINEYKNIFPKPMSGVEHQFFKKSQKNDLFGSPMKSIIEYGKIKDKSKDKVKDKSKDKVKDKSKDKVKDKSKDKIKHKSKSKGKSKTKSKGKNKDMDYIYNKDIFPRLGPGPSTFKK
jgi:hypothetical protein